MKEVSDQKRVLLTEIGSNSSGDEVLYRAATNRFVSAGWHTSLLCRIGLRSQRTLAAADEIHELIVDDWFEKETTSEQLVAEFARRQPLAYGRTRALVEQHDLVAICPGGRFTSGYNNPRGLLTAAVAIQCGIPLVNLHQSFGPLERSNHRKLLASVLSRALINLVRDDRSLEFLKQLRVPIETLVSTRDVAFAEDCGGARGIRYEVGLNIRHGFNGHVQPDVLRDFLQRLQAERPGLSVLTYSTTHTMDSSILDAVDGLSEVEPDIPLAEDALSAPSACRVNISDSFHGVIFSMLAGRPTIPLQTDFDTWKIQGTQTPGAPDFAVQPGFTHRRCVPDLVRETLRLLDNPEPTLATQAIRLQHGREWAEAGWSELFKRVASAGIGGKQACA